jgi:CubicO group peptidase (beta-lactamase class C family)
MRHPITYAALAALFAAPATPPAVGLHTLPAAAAADTLGDRLERELGPWLDERARAGAFSGVVLVAKNGIPIYSAAYGLADREANVPNKVETPFNLGSMNKMWTAIAIAQLVEAGKVDLDATVGKYVPDMPNQDIRDKVKVRHLLSHTSGMGSYMRKGFLREKTFVTKMSDYIPFYADEPLSFTPGERMQYSNSGFAVLGLIIERVSGQSFYDYMQKNILDKAGMKRAAYIDRRSHPKDLATGYTKPDDGGALMPNWDLIEQHSSPAGGAYANAADLVAFSRALWSGKLVNHNLVRQFTTGQVAMGPQMQYAFGFGTGAIGKWRQVGHNGGIAGANAEFMMFPDRGVDVVVLANMDGPAATQVIGRVVSSLTGTNLQLLGGGPRPQRAGAGGPGGPTIVTAEAGRDGQGRTTVSGPPDGTNPLGPPATLPPGTPTDRLPDTQQGKRVAAFLDAYGKGSGQALEAFLTEHALPRTDRTMQERVQGLEGIYDRTGKMTFLRLLGVRDDQIRIAVMTEKDGEIQLFVGFEPSPTRRVTGFNFEAGNRER